MEVIELLESAYDARTIVQMDKQKLIDAVLTPEVKAQLADIDAEFAEREAAIGKAIADLEASAKAEVVALGETVKGERIQLVYTKGRVLWDTKALDGYAAAHPEIAQFRKEGEPSVSIRVGKK